MEEPFLHPSYPSIGGERYWQYLQEYTSGENRQLITCLALLRCRSQLDYELIFGHAGG